jgi:hypothetical protein
VHCEVSDLMKYWAKISDLGLVENVTVGDSVEWLTENIGGVWVETFPDGSERGNYAGVGYTYDEALDVFVAPVIPEVLEVVSETG